MSSVRTCEICGKEYESNLIIRCLDCLKTVTEMKIKTERLFRDLAESNGWEATKKGYPDFICYRGDDFALVEIKKNANNNPSECQSRFMRRISRFGVQCKVWRPSDNFILG